MDKGKILIIGGYGAVGKTITEHLVKTFPNEIIIAGRNLKKAETLAQSLDWKVSPMICDINDTNSFIKYLKSIQLVIMCLDQTSTKFANMCFSKGIHYIDITANYNFIKRLKLLDKIAIDNKSTAIVSVGLAPGVTNLLVKHSRAKLKDLIKSDIFIMVGLGERHGDAAFKWILDNVNTDYEIPSRHGLKKVISLSEGKTFYANSIGKRTAYRFNFSDQHFLPETQSIEEVNTRICFDSKLMTQLLVYLKKSRLSSMIKNTAVQSLFVRILSSFNFGSDIFITKVISENSYGKHYECSLKGYGEGQITGIVTAELAKKILQLNLKIGVYHIDELIEPIEFFNTLMATDNSLEFVL